MKLAELRKDDTKDMIIVKATVDANHVRAVEKEGISVEKVIRFAFAEVHEKLLKEAVIGALEKPIEQIEIEKSASKDGKRARVPKVSFDKELAKKLREQGMTIVQVAEKVGVSYSTLRRIFFGTSFLERQKGKSKKSSVPKKLRNKSTVWTPKQIEKLEVFYNDSRNHYKSGLIRGDKLGKFARDNGRTLGSVSVKMTELGLHAKKVYGSRRKRAPDVSKQKQIQKQPKPKQKGKRFVQLPTNVDVEATKSVIQDMINGRELRQLDAIVLGIDSEDGWVNFVQEFILKSKQIAEYFGVPDKFYVVRANKGGLEYSCIGYKQGLFGMKRL